MISAVADTHALIWYTYSDPRLSAQAKSFIDSAATQGDLIAISSITFVEMVYLIEKGRIAAESLTKLAAAISKLDSVFVEIPLDLTIARALSKVSVTQVPDMPDRILAATALHLSVPLISRD